MSVHYARAEIENSEEGKYRTRPSTAAMGVTYFSALEFKRRGDDEEREHPTPVPRRELETRVVYLFVGPALCVVQN
jgi:hypothetical protein